eukprot:205365-Pyramimonas_sp.AAC.1
MINVYCQGSQSHIRQPLLRRALAPEVDSRGDKHSSFICGRRRARNDASPSKDLVGNQAIKRYTPWPF